MSLRLLTLALLVAAAGCGRAPEPEPVAVETVVEPAPPADSRPIPTCALLDPSKTPQGAILEAKLLGDPAATWVERANIDAVLKEQQLQAAFGPQGVADRVKLGRLLKADLLVLVRPVKDAKEPALELVVSETAGGLRLLVRGVPITKDSDADVAAFQAAIREGIKKHSETVREVVAVPPFVSTDFAFTYDHLKGAFAKLAEAEALNRPGVVVVELEEAQAVAKELALNGEKLKRPLPVYLLGEYRHEGKDADRTVSVKLRAERGGKPVGTEGSHAGKPDAAPGAVREWSAKLLDTLLADGQARPPTDPRAEAKQLFERATAFKRLGNWEESLSLIEAGLLLDRAQPDAHNAAVETISRILFAKWFVSLADRYPFDIVSQRCLDGFDHLQAHLELTGTLPESGPAGIPLWNEFLVAPNSLHAPGTHGPELLAKLQQLRAAVRERIRRLMPLLVKRGKIGEEVLFVAAEIRFLAQSEKEQRLREYAAAYQNDPNARSRIRMYLGLAREYGKDAVPDNHRKFLQTFATHPNAAVRLAAVDERREFDAQLERYYESIKIPALPANPGLVKLSPVELESAEPTARNLKGVQACGTDLDVFWSDRSLFVMKNRGRLELVWKATDLNDRISNVCFDGRLVWVAKVITYGEPALVAFDPRSNRTRIITSKDGLPPVQKTALNGGTSAISPMLLAAPIEPGRVGVAWSQDRAWVGTVSLDVNLESLAVKPVLSASETENASEPLQWKKTGVVFRPAAIVAVGQLKPGAERRLLIGREASPRVADLSTRPLVFEPGPDTVHVSAGEYRSGVRQQLFSSDGEVVYGLEHLDVHEAALYRVTAAADAREIVAMQLPHDYKALCAREGRVHVYSETLNRDPQKPGAPWITDRRWWTVDLATKRIWMAASDLPELRTVANSSHFGLVALVGVSDDPRKAYAGAAKLHTVVLTDPPEAAKKDGTPRPKGTRHPEEINGLKSGGEGGAARFTITNSGGRMLRLYWIDGDGNRKFYAGVMPGKSHEQATFVGHVWVVADSLDNALQVIRPEAKPLTFDIAEPDKK